MKKPISYLTLDASLLSWLSDKLRLAPAELPGAKDLQESLDDLLQTPGSCLMVEAQPGDTPPPAPDAIQCRDLVIQPRFRRVTRAGQDIPLTPKEFDILCFLARNRGEVFTKEQIYQAVWESEYLMDASNIMAFIRKLRKKIEPNPDAPQYIQTIWGIGYKFTDEG